MNWTVLVPDGVTVSETLALSAAVNTALMFGVPFVLVVAFLFIMLNLPVKGERGGI